MRKLLDLDGLVLFRDEIADAGERYGVSVLPKYLLLSQCVDGNWGWRHPGADEKRNGRLHRHDALPQVSAQTQFL